MREPRKRLGLLIFVFLFPLVGCATKETTIVTLPPTALPKSSWIGHATEDVIAKWGSASEREPDGRGGQILVYDKTTSVLKETPPVVNSPVAPIQTTPIKKILAKFWVDETGKVYKIWFADEVYEKGQDLAPTGNLETEEEDEAGKSGGQRP